MFFVYEFTPVSFEDYAFEFIDSDNSEFVYVVEFLHGFRFMV